MRVACLRGFAVVAASVALMASPAIGETIESATTPFDVDKCTHKAGHEAEDEGEWHCVGYAGIPVLMTAGDVRVYISYGAKAAHEPAATQTLAAPNGEGKCIEWRIVREPGRKGRPFATIMRWSTAIPVDDPKVENGTYRGEMLVVTRLGPGAVCHVGCVDARQNANAIELAREIADRHARTFRCGKDKPIVVGDTGPGFSGLYGNSE
jgi:hypothetical protein